MAPTTSTNVSPAFNKSNEVLGTQSKDKNTKILNENPSIKKISNGKYEVSVCSPNVDLFPKDKLIFHFHAESLKFMPKSESFAFSSTLEGQYRTEKNSDLEMKGENSASETNTKFSKHSVACKCKVTLTNMDKENIVLFKMMTTKPNRYSVHPSVGKIDPSSSKEVEIHITGANTKELKKTIATFVSKNNMISYSLKDYIGQMKESGSLKQGLEKDNDHNNKNIENPINQNLSSELELQESSNQVSMEDYHVYEIKDKFQILTTCTDENSMAAFSALPTRRQMGELASLLKCAEAQAYISKHVLNVVVVCPEQDLTGLDEDAAGSVSQSLDDVEKEGNDGANSYKAQAAATKDKKESKNKDKMMEILESKYQELMIYTLDIVSSRDLLLESANELRTAIEKELKYQRRALTKNNQSALDKSNPRNQLNDEDVSDSESDQIRDRKSVV